MTLTPRGIRNNNPGNIRFNERFIWRGQSGQDSEHFLQFTDALHGIRAMALLLGDYVEYHGIRSIRALIERWAPYPLYRVGPYADYVARACLVDPTERIHLLGYALCIITSMIQFENGENPYSAVLIQKAINLSHIH